MKLLIMCEGPNELKVINILLENQKLKFSSDDLLGLVPYHARQIKSSAAVTATAPHRWLKTIENKFADALRIPSLCRYPQCGGNDRRSLRCV